MNRVSQALLGLLLTFMVAPALYAANPCTTGGAPMMRDGNGAGGTGLRPESGDGTGQGGTGVSPGMLSGTGEGSGIGGTGIASGKLSVDGDGSGTGGTGHAVEVEGVITGFASICVNGLELHYLPTTPITIQGFSASPRDLKVGQVVRALARGQGDQLALQQVHVSHVLVAQVEALGAGTLRAQGRSITLSPTVVMPGGLAPGDKVAISGFAGAQGRVLATRLDVVPSDTPDSVTGQVQRNSQGRLTIDNVALTGDLAKLEPGDLVRAEGRFAEGRMQVARIEREERIMPVDRVVIQGIVRHASPSAINVNGQHFLIDSQTLIKQSPPRAGEWVKIDALRTGRQFHAREVETHVEAGYDAHKPVQEKGDTHHRGGHEETLNAQNATNGSETKADLSNRETDTRETSDRPETVEKPETPEKAEAPEHVERPEKIEAPERVERPEKIEAPEPIERPEKVEVPERIERPEKVEVPERIERPEKIEIPERVERPEPIEIH